MAIRLVKSGELMMIYGQRDEEPDAGHEWNTRRRKLTVFLVSVAIVTVAMVAFPHMPGAAIVGSAVKSIVAAIW
ncbi:MAG TPA: hypothetical protein VNM47_04120 [Terriglobia bacterium]|nr:hypothetical protein [Terriglobia bacterium]